VGIGFFVVAFWWLRNTNLIGEFLRPQVDDGKLSAPVGNSLASVLEIAGAVFVAVGAFWIRVGGFVVNLIMDTITDLRGTNAATTNGAVSQEEFVKKRVKQDMANLLVEMVENGRTSMVVSLVNEMADRPIVEQYKPSGGLPPTNGEHAVAMGGTNIPNEWGQQ